MIVIGDRILDRYMMGTSDRLSPEAPVPVIVPDTDKVFEGGAANVMANIKAFGPGPHLFIYNENQTTVKTRVMSNGHMICRIDEEKYTPFRPNIDAYNFNGQKTAIISDYNKGVVDDPEFIIRELTRRDIDIFVDPKQPFKRYAGAYAIKANKKEFENQVMAKYEDHTAGIFCEELCFRYDICHIIITLGADGCYVYDGLSYQGRRIYSEKKTVIDVTGAGDVFIAALAHYHEQGYHIFEAADLANKLAGISVSHSGTYVLTKEDIASVSLKQLVVFTNGCFDVLHRGHIELLAKSKALGHKLIVGLNSDASIRKLKGPNRPINSQENRKIALEAISYVDEVIIFDDDTPYSLIDKLRPDIITKGGDYTKEQVVGNNLASVVIIPTVEGCSSTNTIERMKR